MLKQAFQRWFYLANKLLNGNKNDVKEVTYDMFPAGHDHLNRVAVSGRFDPRSDVITVNGPACLNNQSAIFEGSEDLLSDNLLETKRFELSLATLGNKLSEVRISKGHIRALDEICTRSNHLDIVHEEEEDEEASDCTEEKAAEGPTDSTASYALHNRDFSVVSPPSPLCSNTADADSNYRPLTYNAKFGNRWLDILSLFRDRVGSEGYFKICACMADD